MPDSGNAAEDNPDYCGPEGNRLRAEANAYGDERHKLLDEAHQAYEAGDKAKAKELSDRGKEAGKKMEETHRKAAEVILKHRNDGHPDTYLDLHGLLLEEALTAFRQRITMLLDKCKSDAATDQGCVFEVIPGAGHHSAGKAVIKPKIIEEIGNMQLPFTEKNAGTLLVTLKAGAAVTTETGRQGSVKETPPPPPTKTEEEGQSSAAKEKEDEEETQQVPPPVNSDAQSKPVESHGCCTIM